MIDSEKVALIIDDDEPFAENAATIPRKMGWDVAIATSGFRAIGMTRVTPARFGLFIFDLELPEENTASVYNTMKEILGAMKIIILSAHEQLIEKFEKLMSEDLVGIVRKGEDDWEKSLEKLIIDAGPVRKVGDGPGPVLNEEDRWGRNPEQLAGSVAAVQKKDILAKIQMIFILGSTVVLGIVLLLAVAMLLSEHPLHRFLCGFGMTVLTIELLFLVYWYIKSKPTKEDR